MTYGRIYGLHDPTSGELRYIGQTVVPLKRRLGFHCAPSHLKTASRKVSWVKSILAQGERPVIRCRARAGDQEELDRLEIEQVTKAKAAGANLVNSMPGGHPDPEVYQSLGQSRRGIPCSPEAKAKISASRRANPSRHRAGTKHTPESKALISKNRRGKNTGAAHHNRRHDISTGLIIQRLSEGFMKVEIAAELGVSKTFVHRRIAEARRAGKEIPEVKRKAWNKGRAFGPEHYANWYTSRHGAN